MEIRNIEDQNKNIINQNEQIFPQQIHYISPNFVPELSNNHFNSETNQNNILQPIQSKENQEKIQDYEKSNYKSGESEEKNNQKTLKQKVKSKGVHMNVNYAIKVIYPTQLYIHIIS